MALLIETGSGRRKANAYVTEAFVLAYLTELERQTTWAAASTAAKEAAIIAATSYIDSRWRSRFKGVRLNKLQGFHAQSIIGFTAQPAPPETLTLGSITYSFVAALTTLGKDEILIGATLADTVANTAGTISGTVTPGSVNSPTTLPNDAATGAVIDGSTTEILLTALQYGEQGNLITISDSSANINTSAFVNGLDETPQAREFPRNGLYGDDGQRVLGVPLKLQQATAEYAVRALATPLYQDPTTDASGRPVTEKFEKIGPIEERTKFQEGGAATEVLKAYPEADALLAEYLKPAGGVIR